MLDFAFKKATRKIKNGDFITYNYIILSKRGVSY